MADDNIDKALPNVEQTITVPGEEAVTELAANLDAQIEDQKNPTSETKTIGE